jgi:hypothetical protein
VLFIWRLLSTSRVRGVPTRPSLIASEINDRPPAGVGRAEEERRRLAVHVERQCDRTALAVRPGEVGHGRRFSGEEGQQR